MSVGNFSDAADARLQALSNASVVPGEANEVPLFMMFSELVLQSRVFRRDGPKHANALREACARPWKGLPDPPFSIRKVFNLVPKFIDSGNVQE